MGDHERSKSRTSSVSKSEIFNETLNTEMDRTAKPKTAGVSAEMRIEYLFNNKTGGNIKLPALLAQPIHSLWDWSTSGNGTHWAAFEKRGWHDDD